MIDKKVIAQNIRRARLEMGLTQDELGKKIGVQRWSMIKYEDSGDIPFDRLQQIAAVTEKDIRFFMSDESINTDAIKNIKTRLAALEATINSLVQRMGALEEKIKK